MNHQSIQKLVLTLPGGNTIDYPSNFKFTGNTGNLGAIVSGFLSIGFMIAAFLTFYYLIWGALSYIFATGDKENLAKAREKIKWALIGLLFVAGSYTLTTYAGQIFTPKGALPF